MRKMYLLAVLAMVMLASCSKDDDVTPVNGELTFVEDYQRSYNRIWDNIDLRIGGIDTTTTAAAFDTQIAELKILVTELAQLKAVVSDRRLSNDFHEDERNRLIELHNEILELEHFLNKRMHMYAELKDGKEEVFFAFNAVFKDRHDETFDLEKAEDITAKMAFLKENNYKELAIIAIHSPAQLANLEAFVANYFNIALVDQVAQLVHTNVLQQCDASIFILQFDDQIKAAYAAIDQLISIEERRNIWNIYLRAKYDTQLQYGTVDNYAKHIVKVSQFIKDFNAIEGEVKSMYSIYITEGEEINDDAKIRINELSDKRATLYASLSWGEVKFSIDSQYCASYFNNAYGELSPDNSNDNFRTVGKINSLRKL